MADKKPTRLPKDFNQNKVDDMEITNPEGAARQAAGIPIDTEYPKHLHKFAGPGQMHDFVEVANAQEEAAKRREGWMSPQEADAVGREAAEAAVAQAPKVAKAPKAAKVAKAAAPAKAAHAKAPKAAKAAKAAKADAEPGAPAAN